MNDDETIADIIAWLRRPREGENAYLTLWRDEIADRLEAAHKREKAAIEADALAVGGYVAATAEKSSAVGDCAKLREVCEKMLDLLTAEGFEDGGMSIELDEKQVIMWRNRFRAALAAPPRNCDLARDWMRDLYAHFQPPASLKREMPLEWVDAVMAFCRWLVAPATERKGDPDEQK